MNNIPGVIGFTAPSGTGKTTLMVGVIHHLSIAGLRVAAIKHGHHPADPDVPGKDTHRYRQSGAETVMFACKERWFLIQDLNNRTEPTLAEQIEKLNGHDIILVEGYKNDVHPKIVLHRAGHSGLELLKTLTHVIAVATDDQSLETELPRLAIDDPASVAQFVRRYLSI